MQASTRSILLLTLVVAFSWATASAKSPPLIADPNPIDPNPIDPILIEPTVYTFGTAVSPANQAFLPSPLWIEGIHAPLLPEQEIGDLLVKGMNIYTLSPGYQGDNLILRKNGAFVREYPAVLPTYQRRISRIWSANSDFYVLKSSYAGFGTSWNAPSLHSQVYKNETLLYQFTDDFWPEDMAGGVGLNGSVNLVLAGERHILNPNIMQQATVWKNGVYVALSDRPSKAIAVARTASGWIYAVGEEYGPYAQNVYWKVSPTNVVTRHPLPVGAPFTSAQFWDIHVSAAGVVYVAGSVAGTQPGMPPQGSAALWINGQLTLLPCGDGIDDSGNARAVTTDTSGNYYVAGSFIEDTTLSTNQASATATAIVWKNGQMYQSVDSASSGLTWLDYTGIVVR